MRKGIWALIPLFSGVSFAFVDSDLDGVEDSKDRCPNTPILELVDRYGCPIKHYRGKFYLRVGGGFLKDGNESRTFSLFSLAYSYRYLYLSFSTRYYLSSTNYDPGMGDSSLFAGYSRFFGEHLYILPGVRLGIPTGDKQYSQSSLSITPSALFDYIFDSFDLFMYLGYSFRGGGLRDGLSTSFGGGYELTKKLYASISYDLSESAVRSGSNSYLSLFLLYDISSKLYTTLSYSKGLNSSATDHSLSGRLGIRF